MSRPFTLFIILILLVIFTSHSLQQNCTSSLYSETEPLSSSDDDCPVAYVNLGKACIPFTTVYKQKKENSCTSKSDCLFASLECVNQKCVPRFRLPGDSCVADIQCVSTVPPTIAVNNMADWVGPKCISGKCQNVKVETRNDGESCYIDTNTKTIYDCKDGSICYQCCTSFETKSKCVPKVMARKGESCFNPIVEDKSTIFNFKYCESGSYCKTLSDASQVCVEPLKKGDNCANSTTRCEDGTICRQNSPTDTTFTCQKIATYGESCVAHTDCANAIIYSSPPPLVGCFNNKCARLLGTVTNGMCKSDDECYTRYCSPEGKCAERLTNTPCSTSANCRQPNACACGGKGSSKSLGRCMSLESCYGPYADMLSCIYNLGVTLNDYFGGFGYSQYVDEDSSLFKKCRNAHSRFYSCFRKAWLDAGIPTTGEMEGIDLDAYSAYATPILPERNGASQNQLVFGLIILSLVNLINLIL